MKTLWLAILLTIGLSSFPALGAVQGSVHDFSNRGWVPQQQLCLPCHTPHEADTTVPDAPLWNHQISTATYTLYSSPTLDVTPEQPLGPSKLCLSCHDGTVAVDSFGGNTGNEYISGHGLIGTDLSDDHPISIKWRHQTDLPHQGCGNCHNTHGGGGGGGSLLSSDLPFFNGYIECPTCHDVHDQTSNPYLLRRPLQNSEICFFCHGK